MNHSSVEGGRCCFQCGKQFADDEVIRYGEVWVCADCKPAFFQKLREDGQQPRQIEYGTFTERLKAKGIDGLIVLVIYGVLLAMVVGTLAHLADQRVRRVAEVGGDVLLYSVPLFLLVVNAAYTIFFLGKFGATPGKMAFGLRVVTAEIGRLGFTRAFYRFFTEHLSMVGGIGYLMAAFDPERRALHDRICYTRVIKAPRAQP